LFLNKALRRSVVVPSETKPPITEVNVPSNHGKSSSEPIVVGKEKPAEEAIKEVDGGSIGKLETVVEEREEDVVKVVADKEAKRGTEKPRDDIPIGLRQKLLDACTKGLNGICVLRVGSEDIMLYQAFLAAQSPSFKETLLNDAEKAEKKMIVIEDAGVEAVKQFVEYVHLGEIGDLNGIAEEVHHLAEKFGVHELMKICAEHLPKPFNDENIIDRLIGAFKSDDEKQMKEALDYVAQPTNQMNFKGILLSDEWRVFFDENFDLAKKIMGAVFFKTKFLQ